MSDDHRQLGPGAEFDGIRELLVRWGGAATGIGDDAAVLATPRGEKLVISVDAFVEGRHFEADWITAAEVGYRATTAALSDLAAMAAAPLAVLFAVNVPEVWQGRLGEIGDGVADAARSVGAKIIGGNIADASELSITTTVIGSVFDPLTRGGARPGNQLYVTGALGGPGAAVRAWKSGTIPIGEFRARFARPVTRVHEARWLADRGATACIDVSDGVIADAGHLAAASGQGIEIHVDRLPAIDGVSPSDAARSGEEYELLLSAPELDAAAFTAAFGLRLTAIGRVNGGVAEVVVFDRGARVAAVAGHDHYSS